MFAFSRSLRVVLCVVVPVVAAIWPGTSAAQVGSRVLGARDTGPLDLIRNRIDQAASTTSATAMEGAVDPQQYVVGPGDVFGISIAALEPISVAIPVTADGHLTLPGAGIVHVAGSTLEEAIRSATAALQRRYSNVDVTLTLSSPRQFYVHVVGAVTAPGRHRVLPVSRVSDAVALAYSDTTRGPVTNPDFRPSLRNIRVIRRDGSEIRADLVTYSSTGATDLNPFLQDGDVISVPAYDQDNQSIVVSGSVPYPGIYDLRQGDTLRDVVALASGRKADELKGSARVTRLVEGATVEQRVVIESAMGADLSLEARDHIFVLPERQLEGFASVEGRVRFPGIYAIREGSTTVDDLLDMAGGLSEDALLRSAYLERGIAGKQLQPGARTTTADWLAARKNTLSDTAEVLRNVRLSDFDFLARAYLAQETRLQSRVSLDLDSGSDQTLLTDGDRVVIPRDDRTVLVFGQVNRPGYVRYTEGQTVAHYVGDADGLGAVADRVYLIEAGTKRYHEGLDLIVRPGDMVFASRQPEIADTSELQRLVLEQRRANAEGRNRTVSLVIQAVSSVVTVVALIVTLQNK